MRRITDISKYEFMQRAFIVGGLVVTIFPCMGQVALLKRLSMIGDTLSHSLLAGLTIGLALGFDPLLAAVIACAFAGLSVGVIRNRLKSYQEISTVIILMASISLVGIFSSMVKNTNSISSYLFGSIVTINGEEFYLVTAAPAFVLISYSLLYKSLYLSISDQKVASVLDINIKFINFCVTFLLAVAISISAKTIGPLIVSSLPVLPSISAMQYTKTYKSTLIVSIIFSVILVYLGLFTSYALSFRPGSVIVSLSVIWLIILLIIERK